MPPRKGSAPREGEPSRTGELRDAIDDLTHVMSRIADHLQVIGETLDEIRDDLGWAINNRDEFKSPPAHIVHITSMPRDPCDPAFGKNVNRITQADIDGEQSDKKDVRQRDLWK
jgi:hypothetical protein